MVTVADRGGLRLKPNWLMLFFRAGFIALLTSLVIPPAPFFAQSSIPQMEVIPAYDGYFKYGEWLPIWVEIENQGSDLDTEIRVQVTGSQGTIVFSVPVQLPSGSRKRVPVYVLPNNFSRELKVDLLSNGKTLVSQSAFVRPQANISFFIGLIAPERQALSLISGIQLPGQERPKIMADITLGTLPDRGEALNSFDLLVLNNTDTSKLTPSQAAALQDWIQQGGHLVIGGGTSAQKTLVGLPDDLKPILDTGTVEISPDDIRPIAAYAGAPDFQPSGRFVAAVGELPNGSKILAGQDEFPLIVQKEVGNGFVDFVALDLSGVPFNGWPGNAEFWEKIIGPGGSYPQNMPFDVSPRQYRANSLYYALSNIPSLDLPSIQWILIILGIYIFLIGPVNFLILRWKHRLHLAWITIPVLTAVFTAGSFGIGYTMRGNDLMLNKIALVQLGPTNDASVTSYMGLFSPRQQNYEVIIKDEQLISPMTGYDTNPWGNGLPTTTGGEIEFVQSRPAIVKGLTVNQWSMQSFMSEGTWDDFGQFTANLSLQNETLTGSVRNDSHYTLSDVVVILQNRFVRLGTMNPGSTKEVDLGLANMQSDRFGPPLSYRIFQENNLTGGPLPRLIEMKTNIVSTVFENSPWVKTISSTALPFGSSPMKGVVLIGWLDQAPPEIEIKGNNLSYQTTTLVYTSLDYQFPSNGYLSLPAGMIPGTVTKFPDNSGTCGYTTSVSMARGQAEFEFQLPGEPVGYRVRSLKLAFWRDNTGLVDMPEISLFRWKDEAWTSIQDPIQGTNVIEQADDYIDQNGLIRVRLTNNSDMFSCIYLDMGMEAEADQGEGS